MMSFLQFIRESRFEGIVDNPSFNDLRGIIANSENKHVKFIVRGNNIEKATGESMVHQDMLPDHVRRTMRSCDSPTPDYPHFRGEIYTGWESGKLYGGLYSRGDGNRAIAAPDDHPILQKMKKMGVAIKKYSYSQTSSS